MKAKDKTKGVQKVYRKNGLKNTGILLAFIIIVLGILIIYNQYFAKNNVYASETVSKPEKIKISKAPKIDIEKIIRQNNKEGQKEEYIVQEATLEYLTKYRNNANLPKGTIQVIQEGREGKQELTIKKTYQEEELVAEEQIASKITKASVNKIVEIGTANYTSHYKAKVGDTVYVTSDRLSVMVEPKEQ